jgi:hypothetical protein
MWYSHTCWLWLKCARIDGGIGMFSVLTFRVGLGRGFGPAILMPDLLAVMSDNAKESPSKGDLVTDSLLYRHFQAQREEVLKHKWYESERAGHDIGFDRALTDWIIKHRATWIKQRRSEGELSGVTS